MKICVSLETAMKLKAAGWDKPTGFIYAAWKLGDGPFVVFGNDSRLFNGLSTIAFAPTTDEILAELPHSIIMNNQICELAMFKKNNSYETGYFMGEFYQYAIAYEDKQLCEALAELWLWAKSNGHIKSEATENES